MQRVRSYNTTSRRKYCQCEGVEAEASDDGEPDWIRWCTAAAAGHASGGDRSTKTMLAAKEAALGEKVGQCGRLESELGTNKAAIGREERSCMLLPSGYVLDTSR